MEVMYAGGSMRDNREVRVVAVQEGVTSIGERAFQNCRGLTTITIPSSVTSIGYSAFRGCAGLTTITIPSSVTSIDERAFARCTGLTTIIIPSSVTSIGDSTFYGCTGLTTITIPSSVTSIGNRAFCDCASLTTITIPSSLCLSEWAFQGCTGLTAAAETRGFATVEEWGWHRFFVSRRRAAVLACVSVARGQIFDDLGQEEPVSELLESLAHVPNDVLRVIVGFVGEG